jgi:citrate lyase subunit beta/citryl-CoA lyase
VHEKDRSRDMIRENLAFIRANASFGEQTIITPRTNGLETGRFHADVDGILTKETISLIDGFCVPKVDRVEEVAEIDKYLSAQEVKYGLSDKTLKVVPQIESTKSMANLKEILKAGQSRFVAAAFGADDFTADFEVYRSDNDKELDFARKWFALNCHAFGVVSVDTPYVLFKDQDGLKRELEFLKSIGMKAKLAIHPTQVDLINQAFTPSA